MDGFFAEIKDSMGQAASGPSQPGDAVCEHPQQSHPYPAASPSPPTIRDRREALGLTIADLATLADTNRSALSYMERGIRNRTYNARTERRVEDTLARLETNADRERHKRAREIERAVFAADRRRNFWVSWLEKTRPIVRREVAAIVGEGRP